MSAVAETLDADAARPPDPELLAGLNVLDPVRQDGQGSLSDHAACLLRLLEALEWTGERRQLAEAVPHFIPDLDLATLRTTMANLRLQTVPVRTRQGRINPGLLPCVFVSDRGPVNVVLEAGDDGYLIYDGKLRQERRITGRGHRGTAYVVRQLRLPVGGRPRPVANWLADMLSRFQPLVMLVLLSTLVFNLLSIAMPLFMMSIYDIIIPSQSHQQLYHLLVGVGIALAMESVFRRLRVRAMAFLGGRIDYLVGRATFERVLLLPIAMLEHQALGSQLARLQEFDSVSDFITSPLGEALFDLPFVALFLLVIAFISGWLVLVPIVTALLFCLIALITVVLARRTKVTGGSQSVDKQQFLVEALSGMRAIKFAGAEAVWYERYRDISAAAVMREFSIARQQNTAQVLARMLMMGAGIATLGFGAAAVMEEAMTVGALVAAMALVWRGLGPLQAAYLQVARLLQVGTTLGQINQLMRLPVEREPGTISALRQPKGRIAFKNVVHRFANEVEPALAGLSFTVEPGEIIAVTGPNGAGKSTLINLIAGLYKPSVGAVLIDGIDTRQLDAIHLRQSIAMVPQTAQLFYGTVAQNFRLVSPSADDEEMARAARLAQVYDDIMRLPDGFDTRLNERAMSELPDGFKQRLTIARSYLRPAPIMLFDEPGQALDEAGDKGFIAAVGKLRKQATIVIVTHRPSHLRMADRILVLDGGRLKFIGPPKDFWGA